MSKPYDYAELWDSFTEEERTAVLSNLASWRDLYGNAITLKWRHCPTTMKFELQAIDWEFALGRRFTSRA